MAGTASVRAALAVGAAFVAAVACGGGASAPATGTAAKEYFPLVAGARWVYEMRTSRGNFRLEVTARGEMKARGRPGKLFVMDETHRGSKLGFVRTAPVAYLVDQGYVARLPAVDYDDKGQLRLLGAKDSPTWLLPLHPHPGETWFQESRLFSTPEGGGKRLGWAGQVRSVGAMEVPAGRFEDVLEIRSEYFDPEDPREGPSVIYRDFYSRGVGLIRSLTLDPTGDESHTVEQRLLEYHFPNGR